MWADGGGHAGKASVAWGDSRTASPRIDYPAPCSSVWMSRGPSVGAFSWAAGPKRLPIRNDAPVTMMGRPSYPCHARRRDRWGGNIGWELTGSGAGEGHASSSP